MNPVSGHYKGRNLSPPLSRSVTTTTSSSRPTPVPCALRATISADTRTDTTTLGILTTNSTSPASENRSTESKSSMQAAAESDTGPCPKALRTTLGDCDSVPPRIVYGAGAVARLPNELGRLRLATPLVVSSPSRVSLARRIQALIPNLDSRILDSAVLQVPPRVVDEAVSRISGRDCVISVGGGSALGLARAIGLRKGIPHICIPTTYSGSELTPLHGDKKFGGKDPKVMPTVVIYDEELTITQPKRISAPNGIGAAAISNHSTERRSSKDDNAQWSYIHLPGV